MRPEKEKPMMSSFRIAAALGAAIVFMIVASLLASLGIH